MPVALKDSEPFPTLCFPDAEKTCFACCPPIRPAGYEHVQYRNMVKRVLRENSEAYSSRGQGIYPITGFSCWALGYLDKGYRLVGCLLHPGRNGGVDLRYRVDYGDKCDRESCPEAKVFLELAVKERKFWLRLADGLDAFAYSSRKINPLFSMLSWGAELLDLIALHDGGKGFSRDSFSQAYPFFSGPWKERANAYLLNRLVKTNGIGLLKRRSLPTRFAAISRQLSGRLRNAVPETPEAPYTYRLDLDSQFLDFLRLSVGISRIERDEALRLKGIVDEGLGHFPLK